MSQSPAPQEPNKRASLPGQHPDLTASSAGASVTLTVREQGAIEFDRLINDHGLRRLTTTDLADRSREIGPLIAQDIFSLEQRQAARSENVMLRLDVIGGAQDPRNPQCQYFLIALREGANSCVLLTKGDPPREYVLPDGLFAAMWLKVKEIPSEEISGEHTRVSIQGHWIFSPQTNAALENDYRNRQVTPLLSAIVVDHTTAPEQVVQQLSHIHFPAIPSPPGTVNLLASRDDGTHHWVELRMKEGMMARFIPNQGEFSNQATWRLAEELRTRADPFGTIQAIREFWAARGEVRFAPEDREVVTRLESIEPIVRRMAVKHFTPALYQAQFHELRIEQAGMHVVDVSTSEGVTNKDEYLFLVSFRTRDERCIVPSSRSQNYDMVPGFAGFLLTGTVGVERRFELRLEGTVVDSPSLGILLQRTASQTHSSVLAESIIDTINSGRGGQGLAPIQTSQTRIEVARILKGPFGELFGVLAHHPGGIYQGCIFVQNATGMIPTQDGILVTTHFPIEHRIAVEE